VVLAAQALNTSNPEARDRLDKILRLYKHWTRVKNVPDWYYPNSSRSQCETGSHQSEGGDKKRSRNDDDAAGGGDGSPVSSRAKRRRMRSQNGGPQDKDRASSGTPELETDYQMSVSSSFGARLRGLNTSSEPRPTLVDGIGRWWIHASSAAQGLGWEAPEHDALGSYTLERSRRPRRKPYHSWCPAWACRGEQDMHKPLPDTSTFSSNDWAYYEHDKLLTGPVRSGS